MAHVHMHARLKSEKTNKLQSSSPLGPVCLVSVGPLKLDSEEFKRTEGSKVNSPCRSEWAFQTHARAPLSGRTATRRCTGIHFTSLPPFGQISSIKSRICVCNVEVVKDLQLPTSRLRYPSF